MEITIFITFVGELVSRRIWRMLISRRVRLAAQGFESAARMKLKKNRPHNFPIRDRDSSSIEWIIPSKTSIASGWNTRDKISCLEMLELLTRSGGEKSSWCRIAKIFLQSGPGARVLRRDNLGKSIIKLLLLVSTYIHRKIIPLAIIDYLWLGAICMHCVFER